MPRRNPVLQVHIAEQSRVPFVKSAHARPQLLPTGEQGIIFAQSCQSLAFQRPASGSPSSAYLIIAVEQLDRLITAPDLQESCVRKPFFSISTC
jgi:hypothetical protein